MMGDNRPQKAWQSVGYSGTRGAARSGSARHMRWTRPRVPGSTVAVGRTMLEDCELLPENQILWGKLSLISQ